MIKIKKLTGENVSITQDGHFSYLADYGFQQRGFDSNFQVQLETEEKISKINARGSCGCVTVTKEKISDHQYNIKVHYDSKLLGRILKTVWIGVNEEKLEVKLRGSVRN